MPANEGDRPAPAHSDAACATRQFVQRALIVFAIGIAIFLLAALAWFAADALLLVFSSILVAILLHHASCAVEKWLPLPRAATLGAVLLAGLGICVLAGWRLAPQVLDQASQLVAALPNALQRTRDFLDSRPMLAQIARHLPVSPPLFGATSSLLTHARSVLFGVIGGLGSAVIITFVSIYLAAQPQAYINGVLKLLPRQKRQRGRAVLDELGATLSQWLLGKLLSMALIGAATALGLTLLGVPLALALGVLAGMLDFIAYLGPILAAIPAVLIAFAAQPILALYVVLFFLALHGIEGYLLLPLVERRTVALPPALTVMMQVLMGLAFGLAGVALATPLTAVLTVLVAMLYVQDVLGDPVTLPARHE